MNNLKLIFAPNEIYRKKSAKIEHINEEIRSIMDQMLGILKSEHAYGIAAPMVGISKQIIVVNIEGQNIFMINPEIISQSEQTEIMNEQSITFLGIEVEIKRAKSIIVEFLDDNGEKKTLDADGILARCIQHEIDYLNGITILDHTSRLKKDMLIKKMQKTKKLGYHPHVHSASCNH